MKRNFRFALVVLLLLLARTCSAFTVDPDFLKEHACVLADDGSRQCLVTPGDTLSEFSRAFRGTWNSYKDIQAASYIEDAKLIYPGMIVVIPDAEASETTSIATATAAPAQTSAAITFAPPVLTGLNKVLATDAAPEMTADILMEDVANTTLSPVDFPTTTPTVVMAADTNKQFAQHSPPTPLAYTYTVNGTLTGALQTQLLLYANNDEKRAGKNEQRIELKDSLAIPSTNGKTTIFIRSGKVPAQPFAFAIGGLDQPVDDNSVVPYAGKIPRQHSVIGTIGTNARDLGKAALFSGGNPYSMAASYAAPKVFGFIAKRREMGKEKKALARQVILDKANLELYRNQVALAQVQTMLKNSLHQEASQ